MYPARKRQRLSSPTYDEQLGDVSQEDIVAFDTIDVLSQGSQSQTRTSQNSSQEVREKRTRAIADALKCDSSVVKRRESIETTSISLEDDVFGHDPDNPFNAVAERSTYSLQKPVPTATDLLPSFQPASAVLGAPHLHCQEGPERTSSPELPPEKDYSSWFQPDPASSSLAFQPANFSTAAPTDPIAPLLGFVKASHKGWVAPSTAALEKAAAKVKGWQADEPEPSLTLPNINPLPSFVTAATVPLSPRPVLRAVENSVTFSPSQLPDSPSPAGFGRPALGTAFDLKGNPKAKAFKSPLLNPSAQKSFRSPLNHGSPLNPNRPLPSTFVPAASQHPLTSASITATPVRNTVSNISFMTPQRPLGLTPRAGRGTPAKPTFVTPFKAGMAPGEAGRANIEKAATLTQRAVVAKVKSPIKSSSSATKMKGKERWKAFDLTKPPNRKTLASSGLVPQSYTTDELESMGINISELSQITPPLALYYSFHSSSPTPLTPSQVPGSTAILGPTAALEYLRDEKGCTLATKPWVDNHWAMVLWKLAGMVSLDPESEMKGAVGRRWCWDEVIRQLLYRYERELNSGSRPPFRLLTTRDAPASSPMVLCISNITWSERGITDDGLPIEPYPELEVTDGWYRLRAQVDEPLAKAVRRGVVRVGRKIGVAGARLSSERKDPSEILEAYNSTKLVLSGNSSHLAPWHAKLGFQAGPFVATLHSLSPDGGVVAVMDVVVEKTYPLAFLEFIEEEDGTKRREGPRSEKEETQVSDRWKRRWEIEESKLRSVEEKKWSKFQGYADRLGQKAGSRFSPGEDDSPPDHIDSLYDDLEHATDVGPIFTRLDCNEARWLARLIRENIAKERETAADKIADELKTICPPREVRNFRVLIVRDANTYRRPANRVAQLTVWDVLGLSLSEGGQAGAFQIGQRFLVTNLMPTQQSAWMDRDAEDAEVYLSTRRDSRWTRIK